MPGFVTKDERGPGGERRAECGSALEHGGCGSTLDVAKRFRDECRARGPLPADAKCGDESSRHHLFGGLAERGEASKDAVDQNGDGERAEPPPPVSEDAED